MAITATTPTDAELAYGNNIITLANDVSSPNRQVLQIFRHSDNEKIAEFRQRPNPLAKTHHQINRVLQAQVKKSPDLGSLDLFTCGNECFDYYIKVGTVSDSGVVTIDATYDSSIVGPYLALPGRKELNDDGTTAWGDYSDYVPDMNLNYDGSNYYLTVDALQKAMTDRDYDTVAYGDITDGKPGADDNFTDNAELVYRIKIAEDQDYSLQFLNRWTGGGTSFGNGLNYIRLQTYNGSTLVSDVYIDNTTINGGGNDTTIGDNTTPTGSAGMIGANIGFQHSDVTDALTHYYVWASAQSSSAYVSDEDVRQSYGYRFDITDGECNDYDNPLEVRWLNSLGGIDYFNFRKKNEKKVNVQRDTYVAGNDTWDESNFRVYPYERGETVFTQTIDEIYTADTRYLSDDESTYLENLYKSPDVQVKFYGDTVWKPVVLTSNTYTQRNFRKDKLFQHSITFRLANKPVAQGG